MIKCLWPLSQCPNVPDDTGWILTSGYPFWSTHKTSVRRNGLLKGIVLPKICNSRSAFETIGRPKEHQTGFWHIRIIVLPRNTVLLDCIVLPTRIVLPRHIVLPIINILPSNWTLGSANEKLVNIPVWCTSPPGAKVFCPKSGLNPYEPRSCDQGLKTGALHNQHFWISLKIRLFQMRKT